MSINWRQYDVWSRLKVHHRRVEKARDCIRRAVAHGRTFVSTSWGKDSVALCDLVLDTVGPTTLVHMASPYELPGYEHIVEHFGARTDVVTLPPTKSLEQYIAWLHELGGLGYQRTKSRQAGPRLKGDRAATWGRDEGYEVQLLGLRADESVTRKGLLLGRGQIYRRRTDGWWCAHPLGWWTVDDVWAWTRARGLPYHRLYECETHGMTHRTLRNSGWLTTIDAGEGRIAWLRRHWPDQYRQLAAEWPEVRHLA